MQQDLFNAKKDSREKQVKESTDPVKKAAEELLEQVGKPTHLIEKASPQVDDEVQVDKPNILTVTQITEQIRGVIEGGFTDLWLSGEVTNFRNRAGRHWYFGLKDEKSQLATVIFNAASRKFSFDLEDGLEVVCHGRLNVYAPRGSYSMIIDHIEPKGVGALQLAFEQLKKKLEAEGLFAKEHKRPLPFMPKKIGVITSATGAAVRDVIHVLNRRFPGVGVLLAAAKVQGEGAAEEVASAIEFLNQREDIDIMIVGRGGGSLEDLWAFNEEVVARAIFASRIPVISAVGHEIDFTIADFVADLRAPTPSAAAEIAVPVKEELFAQIKQQKKRLYYALQQNFLSKERHLEQLKLRIQDPSKRLPELMLKVDSIRERLHFVMQTKMTQASQHLTKLYSNLDHLSPLNVLAKGYSVLQKPDGASVKSASQVKTGEELQAKLHEGELKVKVLP